MLVFKMKKIMMLMLCMMLLAMPLISSVDFDNDVDYEDNDMTAILKNWWGLFGWLGIDDVIGKATLTSHISTEEIVNVIYGNDRVPMYYHMSFPEGYENGLGEIAFTDEKTGFETEKGYKYVKAIYEEFEMNREQTICIDEMKDDCYNEVIDTFIERRIVGWEEMKDNNIPVGNTTIGMMVDVERGEYLDAKWTIAGQEATKHASWQEGFNTGQSFAWLFDEVGAETNVIDNVSSNDGTTTNTPSRVAGMIGNAIDYEAAQQHSVEIPLASGWNSTSFTMTMLWNPDTPNDEKQIFDQRCGGGAGTGIMLQQELTFGITYRLKIAGATSDVGSNKGLDAGTWVLITMVYNSSDMIMYINGTKQSTIIAKTGLFEPSNEIIMGATCDLSAWVDGQQDETIFWSDTVLTDTQVSDIWDSYVDGNGWTDVFGISVDIDFPTNTTYSDEVTELNYTVSGGVADSCWYSLNGGANSSRQDWGVNWTGLSSVISNNWTVYCNDSTNTLGLDSIAFALNGTLEVNITFPENTSYAEDVNELNYTIIGLGQDSCWNSLDGGITNSSRQDWGVNFTGLNSATDNNWRVYCNSTFGFSGFDNVSFVINRSVTTTLISPEDLVNKTINSVVFNFNSSVANAELSNVTLFVWNSSDDIFVQNFTALSGTAEVTTTINTTNFLDGNYTWNALTKGTYDLIDWDINRSFEIDSTSPTINITSPLDFIDYHLVDTNLSFNWTVSDSNLDSCWVIYGDTNSTVICNDLNTSFLIANYTNRTFSLYANDTFGNVANDSITWNYYIFENNQTFNNETIEGNLETFLANLFRSSGITLSEIILVYNSTNYTGESFTLGDSIIVRLQDFLVPNVGADANQTFYWDLILSNGVRVNLTANTQLVLNLGMDNCTTFTTQILNLSVYDEELQTAIPNATVETAVNLYSSDGVTPILNVSGSFISPTGICLNINLSSGVSYSMDTIIRYEAALYANEYYNIVNFTLNNDSELQDISLYDLNASDSTDFKITFFGEDFFVVENALIYIDRQYISENSFKTVELPKTDSNGQTVGHFVRNDIIYNIIVVKDGEIIGTYLNIIAFCEDYTIGDCQMILEATTGNISMFNYNQELGIIFNTYPTYDDTLNTVSFGFTSSNGEPKTVIMEITRKDIFGNRSICNDTLTSASGVLTCSIDPNIKDTLLEVNVYAEGATSGIFNIGLNKPDYGSTGFIFWFIFTLVIILIFGESKTVLLISLPLSYIGAIVFGISSGGIVGAGSAGIWLILITIAGIWRLNREAQQ